MLQFLLRNYKKCNILLNIKTKIANVVLLFYQHWVRSSPGERLLHSGGSEFDSRRIHQNSHFRAEHVI